MFPFARRCLAVVAVVAASQFSLAVAEEAWSPPTEAEERVAYRALLGAANPGKRVRGDQGDVVEVEVAPDHWRRLDVAAFSFMRGP